MEWFVECPSSSGFICGSAVEGIAGVSTVRESAEKGTGEG